MALRAGHGRQEQGGGGVSLAAPLGASGAPPRAPACFLGRRESGSAAAGSPAPRASPLRALASAVARACPLCGRVHGRRGRGLSEKHERPVAGRPSRTRGSPLGATAAPHCPAPGRAAGRGLQAPGSPGWHPTAPPWCSARRGPGRPVSPPGRGPPARPCAHRRLLLLLPQVDDILGEGSDESDSEKRRPEEPEDEQEAGPRPREPTAPGAPQGPKPASQRGAGDSRGPR